MIEILDIEGHLNNLILSIETKFVGRDIPQTSLKAVDKLNAISRTVFIIDKNYKELEIELDRSRRSHTVTSSKYCKAMLLNAKMLKTIGDLERKNLELLKGIE